MKRHFSYIFLPILLLGFSIPVLSQQKSLKEMEDEIKRLEAKDKPPAEYSTESFDEPEAKKRKKKARRVEPPVLEGDSSPEQSSEEEADQEYGTLQGIGNVLIFVDGTF